MEDSAPSIRCVLANVQTPPALNFDAKRNCAILKKLSVNGFFVCLKWDGRAGQRGREEPVG
jgi:hypothetical protein